MENLSNCKLCPRQCNANRTQTVGYCGIGNIPKLSKAMIHHGEEPCISGNPEGEKGSGAVFFTGCNLRCCFCQNFPISHENYGKEISIERLADIFLELQDKGAYNINLVNPTHQIPFIIKALEMAKPKLQIPILYNTGGYDTIESLQQLDGLIDIYLPDLKYKNPELSKKYSSASNYFEYASKAIIEMYRQIKTLKFDDSGMMQKGLIIRHLVLPHCHQDSIDILNFIAENFDRNKFLISLMRQYTPCYKAKDIKEISHKIMTYEYQKVLDRCIELDLQGYMQEKYSATTEMTPNFDLEGV